MKLSAIISVCLAMAMSAHASLIQVATPSTSTFTAPVPTNGLTDYFTFSGSFSNNVSKTRNGSAQGNVGFVTDRFNNPNSAAHFDGASYVVISNAVSTKAPYTWSVWIKPDVSSTNAFGTIITQGGTQGNYGYTPSIFINACGKQLNGLTASNSGQIAAYNYDSSSLLRRPSLPYVTASTKITSWNTNSWYHIAYTLDTNKVAKIYINGKLESSNSPVPFGDGYTTTYIGGSGVYNKGLGITNASFWGFAGCVDDVTVYNRVLASNEVSGIYNAAVNLSEGQIYYDTVGKHFWGFAGTNGWLQLDNN